MSGNPKTLKLCTLDKQDQLSVTNISEGKNVVEADKYVSVDNVYYPFKYYRGIQTCNEEQYKQLTEGLI